MVQAHSRWRSRSTGEPGAGLTGEALFSIIWEALADLLGTAAAAVIFRRAAKRAVGKSPELAQLEISVREREHRCTVPSPWREGGETPPALQTLVDELMPLLLELTGGVAIRCLEQIPELRGRVRLGPGPEEKTS